jgi:3-oxoacyl-[acyl-carrier protein] reductase
MTFAREFESDGIRVNAIASGVILTDTIRSEMAPDTLARIKGMQFVSDDGAEQDIVEAMLYLTSPPGLSRERRCVSPADSRPGFDSAARGT